MLLLVFAVTLAAYLLLACAYIGWGALVLRAVKSPALTESPFVFLWTGWSAALLLLHVWNFFAPVNGYASGAIFGFGVLAFLWFARNQLGTLRKKLPAPAFLILILGIALWLAARSMLRIATWDTGLYHLNSIRWLNEYAVVPGLGNLHGRLAFNQSFFAYVAALNFYPWFNHGYNLANSFMLLAALTEFLLALRRIVKREYRASDLLAAFFIPLLVYYATTINLSAPSPNTASALLQILLLVYLAREADGNFRDEDSANAHFAFVLILSATAVTVKLSNLVFAAAVALIAIWWKTQPLKAISKDRLRQIFYYAIPPFLILLAWMARGIILSGCPVFPATIGCVPVKWAVPLPNVQFEAERTYVFSRYGLELRDKSLTLTDDWLAPWFEREILGDKTAALYPLMISVFAFVALAFAAAKKSATWKYLLVPLPAFFALAFWFFMAPDLRFAYALLWTLPLALVYALLKIFEEHPKRFLIRWALFFFVNASLTLFFIQNPRVFADIAFHGYEPLRTSELILKQTSSGLGVWTPESPIGRCWDAPLPCAQEFNPALRLLGADLQSGFMLAPE